MKYVRLLAVNEVSELERMHREGCSHRERQRAQAILLSSRGYGREAIADICGVTRDTVSDWIHRFEGGGCLALRDAPKSGRPGVLTEAARQMIVQALEHPTPRLKSLLLEGLKKRA